MTVEKRVEILVSPSVNSILEAMKGRDPRKYRFVMDKLGKFKSDFPWPECSKVFPMGKDGQGKFVVDRSWSVSLAGNYVEKHDCYVVIIEKLVLHWGLA